MHCKDHQLTAENTRLVHDNRALLWLLCHTDSELSMLLSWAEEDDGIEHILGFLSWALKQEIILDRGHSLDLPPCPHCSQPMPF